jgi:hypothetical protein
MFKGYSQVITVICKDLNCYVIDITAEMNRVNAEFSLFAPRQAHRVAFDKVPDGYDVHLVSEPTRLPGGTMFPRSIFRENLDHNDAERNLLRKINPDYGETNESKKYSKGFKKRLLENTKEVLSTKIDKEFAFGGYHTQHFDHIRQFIET